MEKMLLSRLRRRMPEQQAVHEGVCASGECVEAGRTRYAEAGNDLCLRAVGLPWKRLTTNGGAQKDQRRQ
jgi:hypothetical protein